LEVDQTNAHIPESDTERVTFLFSAGIQDTQKKGLPALPEGPHRTDGLEAVAVGFRGIAAVRGSGSRLRLGFATIEPAYEVGTNGPRGDLRGRGFSRASMRTFIFASEAQAYEDFLRLVREQLELYPYSLLTFVANNKAWKVDLTGFADLLIRGSFQQAGVSNTQIIAIAQKCAPILFTLQRIAHDFGNISEPAT
jgi:hypothetical protein